MARSGGLGALAKDEHRDGFYQRKILWALSIINDSNRYCCDLLSRRLVVVSVAG